MNELTEAQMEYIRALKCMHYFLNGEAIRQYNKHNTELSKVIDMCDSRLLIERINASNSFFNVPGSSKVDIPENRQAAFDAGITYALDIVLTDPYFETEQGTEEKEKLFKKMHANARRLRALETRRTENANKKRT